MTKSTGIKLFSAAASLAIVWGCMQVDSSSEDQASTQNSNSFNTATAFVNQLVAAQKSTVLAKAASTSRSQSCETEYTECSSDGQIALSLCVSSATTSAQLTTCSNNAQAQSNICLDFYDDCRNQGTDPNPYPTPTPGGSGGNPAACDEMDVGDFSSVLACFQALGACQGLIDVLSDLDKLGSEESHHDVVPPSIVNLIGCLSDDSEEPDIASIFSEFGSINSCLCGAGGGNLFGNILQSTFSPLSSTIAPRTFSPSSSTTAPSTFNPSSSNTAPSTFDPSSSRTAENTFSP